MNREGRHEMADPLSDAVEVIEHFYREELTDGLPVIPPTPEQVGRFLDAAGVGPGEVLGTRASRNWRVTADKVAINAVMAGCLPEYAPVVVAMMRGLLEPGFNASALAETTGASAAMVVINGPVRNTLDVNCGWNLLGPGRRANATIGRALRLVLMNVCREIPGVTDKSTFGHSGRYTMCFGENEEASPWSPYHVDIGFPLEASAVTLLPVGHPMEAFNQRDQDPEGILGVIAHTIASTERCHGGAIVVISPEHAGLVSGAGWSKQDVKGYIAARANELRPALAPDQGRSGALAGAVFPGPLGEADVARNGPDDILTFVAGGPAGGHSMVLPLWGQGICDPVTKEVTGPR